MDRKRVKSSLDLISKVYGSILHESHQYVLPDAQAAVDLTKEKYDWAQTNRTRDPKIIPNPWGYTIHHDHPLQFIPVQIPNGVELHVDVYGQVLWEEDRLPLIQDIKIRVWSDHQELIFDEDRDAEAIYEQLLSAERNHTGRVISRFHLDKANRNQKYGPKYHLQFGGISESYELCWHPKKVNVPRLEYHPMELFLTCQMIAANFFWEEYLDIKSKWRNEIIFYQDLFLKSYYEECLRAINNRQILLESLWVS
jgi:hypothetical protein